MAKLLLINATTYREGVNSVGDIVGIFDGEHVFSENEQTIFDVVSVPNLTRNELISALKHPEIQTITDDDGTDHRMWRNTAGEKWRKLAVDVKYLWSVAGVTDEERAYLLSDDVPGSAKIAMLEQFGNNLSYQAENRTTQINISVTETAAE